MSGKSGRKEKEKKTGTIEEKIKEEVVVLEKKVAELEDKLLRTHADFDNYRKRTHRDLSEARNASRADTIMAILSVLDHFKLAVAASENSNDMNVLRDGMKMILAELEKAMKELGLESIEAIGQKFDTDFHEAVARESSDKYKEGEIISQWRCGYRIGERVLRPAGVVVSSGPAVEKDSEKKVDSNSVISEQ